MASGDRKRPAPSTSKAGSSRPKCPSRFIPKDRKQPGLPWIPRAGYDGELGQDSQLLHAAKNYFPEG